jgi:vacuolar-type H+-ATPase subunit I/STV1
MQQPNGFLQVVGEMVSIVVLALTGRFIGFAQTTLESGVPLTVERALNHFMDILSVFTRLENAGLLLSVLVGASLVRIGLAYANRSVLVGLRDMAGVGEENLSWGQRTLRLPIAILYRSLSGIATFVGAIALAICFRLLNPENPFGFAELGAYVQSISGGITYGGIGALLLLFALYGMALASIGYIASPAVLSLEEMASGCRPDRRPPNRQRVVKAGV